MIPVDPEAFFRVVPVQATVEVLARGFQRLVGVLWVAHTVSAKALQETDHITLPGWRYVCGCMYVLFKGGRGEVSLRVW